jgi:hypothetical protein
MRQGSLPEAGLGGSVLTTNADHKQHPARTNLTRHGYSHNPR